MNTVESVLFSLKEEAAKTKNRIDTYDGIHKRMEASPQFENVVKKQTEIGESKEKEQQEQVNESNTIHRNATIDTKQFGKRIGKHAFDYGLSPKRDEDRRKMMSIIEEIVYNPDEIRKGQWRGQTDEYVLFFVKGKDVVVLKKNGSFITILKGGIMNERVKNARKQ